MSDIYDGVTEMVLLFSCGKGEPFAVNNDRWL